MKSCGVILGVLAAIVVVLVWNLVIFAPKGRDLSAAKEDAQAAQAIEPGLRASLARLQEISKNGPEIAAELDRLSAAIPAQPDLDGFILSANQIAVESGIDWLSVSPGVVQAGTGGPSVIPLTISIQGGFFQVLDYLNRLEDLGRLVIVDAINVTSSAGDDTAAAEGIESGSPALAVTLTGQMYTMAAPSAEPGSTPAPGPADNTTGTTAATPPASGNSSGGTTSTTGQVN